LSGAPASIDKIVEGQRRTFRRLIAELEPHWRSEAALPARIERLLRGDRRMGSRDRRLQRELIYTAIRQLPWHEALKARDPALAEGAVAWLAAEIPSTAAYRSALKGWPPCPSTIAARANYLEQKSALALPSLLPPWAATECPITTDPRQYEALNTRAPLWLRINPGPSPRPTAGQRIDSPPTAPGLEKNHPSLTRLGEERSDEHGLAGIQWRPSGILEHAVRVERETDITRSAAYRDGLVEVQDLGSQLILEAVRPLPGERWLDACAGAGGKALQLAAMVGPNGQVDAFDVRPLALQELLQRAARAKLPPGRVRVAAAPGGPYDAVLVDAPCSGSGTWRRSPHLKWVTSPQTIAAAAELQLTLLERFSAHVRPGGRLIYATCSLATRENERVSERFAAGHLAFLPEPPAQVFTGRPAGPGGLVFAPADHDGDGFFVACFRRRLHL
jgi:16S rRNA (cytosine967-C5)-methyltransferase